ncbi:conserved hypothetical protein [Ricinus communis]|uniref:Uncharacterized protein n=1 Tax=Ricinus communis TaxID=3988 RepID=B9TMF6_RICCO|nr:conserved hypothetical protein [Ricinus communis]
MDGSSSTTYTSELSAGSRPARMVSGFIADPSGCDMRQVRPPPAKTVSNAQPWVM